MRRLVLGAFAALTLTQVGASCTALDPSSDTAASVFGTGGQAGTSGTGGTEPLPTQWACLADKLVPVDQPPQRVQYVVAIVDFDSQPAPNTPTSVPGLKITVCGSPSCDPPYKDPDVIITNPIPGQPAYVFSIEFPPNFSNGSLRLTAPGYAPMDYIFGGPMKGPPEGGYVVKGLTIPLLKTATRDTIYSDLGLSGPDDPDPLRGVLAVRTLDCERSATGAQGVRAAGVRLQATPEKPPGAVAWTLSFSNRATPNKLETDARGVAGFVNVLPGTLDVAGVPPVGSGLVYGRTTLAVRAGVITLAEVRDGIDRWGQ